MRRVMQAIERELRGRRCPICGVSMGDGHIAVRQVTSTRVRAGFLCGACACSGSGTIEVDDAMRRAVGETPVPTGFRHFLR